MTFASRPLFSTRFAPAARRAVVAAGLALLAGAAAAQAYPAKQISFVNNFTPGGPSDMIARSVADVLQKRFSQPVVVENKPGAAGNIGATQVARSKPDGYTVLIGIDTTFTVNPHIYKGMPFKPADFRPIMVMASSGLLVGAHRPPASRPWPIWWPPARARASPSARPAPAAPATWRPSCSTRPRA